QVEKASGMTQIRARCQWLLSAPQPPVRCNDGRDAGNDFSRVLATQRDRSRRCSKRIHRIEIRTRTLAQQVDSRRRQGARGCERRAKGFELFAGWEIAMPQEPGGLFECRVLGELADGKSRDDQLTAFDIDVTESGRGRDHTFQTTVRHTFTLRLMYHLVNID